MKREAVLSYDFYQVNSTIIADRTTTGAAGVIRNYDTGGTEIITDSIYGSEVRAIRFPGGEDGGYVQLPDGILNSSSGVTVSCWCRINSVNGEQALWSFGEDNGFYLNILHDSETGRILLRPCVTSGGRSQELSITEDISISTGRWHMLTVTLEGGPVPCVLSLYVDGLYAAGIKQRKLSSANLSDATFCCIGMGAASNEPCCCDIASFEIYNYDMNKEEVLQLFNIPDSGRVTADLSEISLPQDTTGSLSLPNSGTYGSLINWDSSSPEVLSPEGSVKRPLAGTPDREVTLTAVAKCGQSEQKREFNILVKAIPTDKMLTEMDLEEIKVPDLLGVYENLSLPVKGSSGSCIKWSSDKPQIISERGDVFRPKVGSPAEKVLLTAEAAINEASSSESFEALVLPEYALKEIKQVMPIVLTTSISLPPSLPTKVIVQYTDDAWDQVNVKWDEVPDAKFNSAGEFNVNGVLQDIDFEITAQVYVVESNDRFIPKGMNIPLTDSRITGDNLFTQNYKRCMDYLKLLDADRMLYNFRAAFNQDTKGAKPLGGWDEPKGLLRGHSTGHFLSALALAFASSGDEAIKDKLDYMVSVLYELQSLSKGRPQDFKTFCSPTNAAQSLWSKDPSTWGEGYLSAYSPDQFALLEQMTPYATIWAPYYTLHKLLAGLLDCYTYAENHTALQAAKGIGLWATERLSAVSPETRAAMWSTYIAGEYGGMNESLAILYNLTGDERFLKGAEMFDNPKVFEGLSHGKDTLAGIHVNQHIPQAIGAMSEYKATGNMKYFLVGKYYWDISVNHYCYSIGGLGRGEIYKEPDILAGNIETDRNCETCAAYNMLKMTRELYSYQPENAAYMDYYERALINQIASSQNPVVAPDMHHGVTYMLPIGPGQRKGYSNDYDDFTCCHGTGMENHVKYQEAAYFKLEDNSTMYVNLYIPSEMRWKERGISLRQTQSFPSDEVCIEIDGKSEFTLKLRIPYWVSPKSELYINGARQEANLLPSSYVSITRLWETGDKILLRLPYSLHLDKTQDQLLGQAMGSVMYGPLVMVAKDMRKNFLTLNLSSKLEDCFKVMIDEETGAPYLRYQNTTFIPMYEAYNINYHTYFQINNI